MRNRPLGCDWIEDIWKSRTVLWLSGVRRAGKTKLCQSLTAVEYCDCELPAHALAVGRP